MCVWSSIKLFYLEAKLLFRSRYTFCLFIHTFTHSLTHSCIRLFIYSFMYVCIYVFVRLYIYLIYALEIDLYINIHEIDRYREKKNI